MLFEVIPFLLLIAFPAGLALLFGVFQGLLAVKLDCRTPVLPVVTGLSALVCLVSSSSAVGMGEQMEGTLALLWTGSAVVGALAGWGLTWAVDALGKRK